MSNNSSDHLPAAAAEGGNHDDLASLRALADQYRRERRYGDARDVWKRIIEIDSNAVDVILRLADADRKAHDFAAARSGYERAMELEPDNAYAVVGLGNLLYEFGKYAEALDAWRHALDRDGDDVDIRVLTSVGNCYRKLGEHQKAREFFERAVDREPDNAYALYGLADTYRGLRMPSESLACWEKMLESDPRNRMVLTRAGDALRTLGRNEEAVTRYRQALELGFDVYAALGLASINRRQHHFDEAIGTLEEVIARAPRNARAYLELADCYADRGRIPEALATLARYERAGGDENNAIRRRVRELTT